jgi:membrane protein YdbS with pleckstrin-like domain
VDLVFRSKVDLWLVALVVGIPVLVLEFMFEGIGSGDGGADLVALAIVVIALAFFLWLYFSTRYTITPEVLVVKSGPFSWIIPLREITKIEPTRNPASSPALSLDRLMIRYGEGGELMVSPADKVGFMTAMKKQLKVLS